MPQDDDRPAGRPYALAADNVPPRTTPSNYPEPFRSRMAGRVKRVLGDAFGLKNFGVNLTTLAPGAVSSLHHVHSRQDEFIYVVAGHPTLVTERGEETLSPGMCAGFPAQGTAHHLENRSGEPVVVLEVGDRTAGDSGAYPRDDLQAVLGPDGKWRFLHKDGTPYGAG